MESSVVAGYTLALTGFGAVIASLVRALAMRLVYVQARAMMMQLVQANPAQIQKLARAVPNTFFDAIGAALTAGANTRSRDPVTIAAATHPAFDKAGAGVIKQWKRWIVRGQLGALCGCAGLAIAISQHELSIPVVVFVALGVIGGVWLTIHSGDTARSIRQARYDMLPEIDKVFVDGRYTAA